MIFAMLWIDLLVWNTNTVKKMQPTLISKQIMCSKNPKLFHRYAILKWLLIYSPNIVELLLCPWQSP